MTTREIPEHLKNLTSAQKLALGAARLRERYVRHPWYAKRDAEDGQSYWENLAASNWNSYLLPVLDPSSATEPKQSADDSRDTSEAMQAKVRA